MKNIPNIILVALILFALLLFNFGAYSYIHILWTAVCLVLAFKNRKFPPYFIIFTFILTYAIAPIGYFDKGIYYSFWYDLITPYYTAKTALASLIFTFSLGVYLQPPLTHHGFYEKFEDFRSPLIYSISFATAIFLMYFGLSGETIVETGKYGTGDVEKSAMYEYSIIPLFICMLSQPRTKKFKLLSWVVIAYFYIKGMLYGARIELAMMALIILYCNFNFLVKFKTRSIISMLFIGYFISVFLGVVRANPLILFSNGDLAEGIWSAITHSDATYISSHQGDVFQAGLRIIYLADNEFLTEWQRLIGGILFPFNAFLPSAEWPDYTVLANYLRDKFSSGGGGLIASYSYAWFDWVGPFLFGLTIAFLLNFTKNNKGKTASIYFMLVISSFPRWFAYSPTVLVKLCVIGALFYVAMSFVKRFSTSTSKRQIA